MTAIKRDTLIVKATAYTVGVQENGDDDDALDAYVLTFKHSPRGSADIVVLIPFRAGQASVWIANGAGETHEMAIHAALAERKVVPS